MTELISKEFNISYRNEDSGNTIIIVDNEEYNLAYGNYVIIDAIQDIIDTVEFQVKQKYRGNQKYGTRHI